MNRRNYVDTASLTPRDKENAGANSTRNSQSDVSAEQSKTSFAPTPQGQSSNKTPKRSRLSNRGGDSNASSATPAFFAAASPPSPTSASTSTNDSNSFATRQTQQQQVHRTPISNAPSSFAALSAQKSPPGTSQVLRKHFQSLGFATPGSQTQQQRLLSTGAVRLTAPSSRKKPYHKKGDQTMMNRLGYDGTKNTPSKELLKSTSSSRSQRIAGLQDMSMEQASWDEQSDFQIQQQSTMETMNEDETSTVASSVDDASFDISLPGVNHHHHSHAGSSLLVEPQSPMTPRMGCSDPVALTLLNDGKEDYHFLMAQDALFPVPKVEDRDEAATGHPEVSLFSSPTSESPSCCLSPASRQSPAEVRGTLSKRARSTLARPVAVMANAGRVSPTSKRPPRLTMRPKPNHVR